MLNQTYGQLVIIGGEEDKTGDCKILREFIRRAGGLKAKIVIMTTAQQLPKEAREEYIKLFEYLGVENVRVVDTICRQDARSSTSLAAINNATGIFFAGGDQSLITSIIKDTEIEAAIHKRFAEGIVIAGTGAGAALMPDVMIATGESQTYPRLNVVQTAPGLSLLPKIVIDQHFSQLGRLGRLIAAIVQHPIDLGLGIDENTAVIVNGKEFEVIGAGAVTVIDLTEISHCNIERLLKDEPLAICGVKLHILPEGYWFDLEKRQPIIKQITPKVEPELAIT